MDPGTTLAIVTVDMGELRATRIGNHREPVQKWKDKGQTHALMPKCLSEAGKWSCRSCPE